MMASSTETIYPKTQLPFSNVVGFVGTFKRFKSQGNHYFYILGST
jgi:hypothetical protein